MADYYDIDDILTEGEFVPVVFHKEVNGVKIDDSVEKSHVQAGSRSELPFWLSKELHLRQALSMSTPACFNHKTRMEIQADASCVDLRSRCPYFYGFGCKIGPMVSDQAIGVLLSSAFKERYEIVLSKAHTAAFAASSKFFTLLTKEETDMYEAAQSSMTAFKKWRTGGPRFQKASILGRKRRPIT